MKKRLLLISLLLLTMLLVCSLVSCELTDMLQQPFLGQSSSTDKEANQTTPDTNSNTGGSTHSHTFSTWRSDDTSHWKICTTCGERMDEGSHVPEIIPGTPATCTQDGMTEGSRCSVCNKALSARSVIPATGQHTSVATGYTLPSMTRDGCISGEICSLCKEVTNSNELIPSFGETCGTYAYSALASREKGEALQAFYRALYESCAAFQDDAEADAKYNGSEWIAVTVPYSTHGLTSTEAFSVLHAMQSDCPIFYWIDTRSTSDGTLLKVHTIEEYADGASRVALNEIIYRGILDIAKPAESAYKCSLYLHDVLIDHMDYAYRSDGTPETAAWAHSVLGYFIKGEGVCETYTETFQMILNYWGFDCIQATGTTGTTGHAWNMVKLDDGQWYWCDLTWDDQPSAALGRIYDYFCKTDAEFNISERSVDTKNYTVPARSTTSFSAPIPTPGTVFVSSAYTYLVVGYNEVELKGCTAVGTVTVPSQATYLGRTYRVVSVGNVDNGLLSSVFARNTLVVNIPASVEHVRAMALSTGTITSVKVDADNPYLFDDNGVAVYKKSPCTLLTCLTYVDYASDTFYVREDAVRITSYAIINNTVTVIVIPVSVSLIDTYAIHLCSSLDHIVYGGTVAQWQALVAGLPSGALPTCSVVCSNGTI